MRHRRPGRHLRRRRRGGRGGITTATRSSEGGGGGDAGRVQRARTAQGCAAPSRAAGGRSPWARVGRRRRSLTRGARPPATGPAPRALVPSPRLHAGPASHDRFRGSATDLVAAVGPRLLKRGPGMRTGRSSDLALVGEMLEETVGGVIDLWSPFVAPLPL
uniref:Uncharacterized protein n=1 Tax=Setaria italica TaxID=4555 RepID=K3ZPB7_SETIT